MLLIEATIIIPTTTDRGPLLPLCVGTVLRQTMQSFEIFIIGDGVNDETRTIIQELVRQDARIHFFDHPKHPRRGEVYRHQALQQARGWFVAYLCDRDLWLPNHLATLAQYLHTATFVRTNYYYVLRNQRLALPPRPKSLVQSVLSSVGHRLDYYRTLPHGWRTTPDNRPTDLYMWEQLLVQPGSRPGELWSSTLLYFSRNDHPGWPTAKRHEELLQWYALLQTPGGLQPALEQLLADLHYERDYYRMSWLLFRGKRLSDLPQWLSQKFRGWQGKLSTDATAENWRPFQTRPDD